MNDMKGMLARAVVAPFAVAMVLLLMGCPGGLGSGSLHVDGKAIDHRCTELSVIPLAWIDQAKAGLHVAYGHTSHGNRLLVGMTGITTWSRGGAAYSFSGLVAVGAHRGLGRVGAQAGGFGHPSPINDSASAPVRFLSLCMRPA